MSRRVAATAVVMLLALPARSGAHRLDEYLQAARVSLARDQITVELDLTPGAAVADAIISLIDRDHDRTISPGEAGAYGQAVLKDLTLQLDGDDVRVTLQRVDISSIDEIRDGVGTIQIRAAGGRAVATGRRELLFENRHQPAISVYLVNALMPEDREVAVVAQRRDARQQAVRIEYRVGAPWRAQVLWLLVGACGLIALIVVRAAACAGGHGHGATPILAARPS
jgi:hypothetical protein